MFDIRQSKRRRATTRKYLICTLVLTALLVGMRSSLADAVWIKGEDQPKYGWVIAEDDQKVVFRLFGDPESKRDEFDRTAIEMLVVNFDNRRLENLAPENFADYRDYAEELAAQKQDPVARGLAVRLYIIAAAGSNDEVRQSSLKGLVALAENDQQRQKWNSLRLLYETQKQIEREPDSTLTDAISPDERRLALQVVRMIRQGKGIEAGRLLGQPATKTAFRHWTHICSVDELTRISLLNRPTLSQLHQLLRIELSIIKNESKTQITEKSQARSWGNYAQAESTIRGAIPSFETATQYDPEESVFRNGRWLRPE